MSEFTEQAVLVDELFMEQQKEEAKHKPPNWHRQVAMSTLFLAMFAAIGALMAGVTSHEIVLQRTEELLEVSVSENDRVNIEVLKAKHEILEALAESPDSAEIARLEVWKEEIDRLERDERELEMKIQSAISVHLIFAMSVTVLSFAITLCGMAVIVEQKFLWIAGSILGAVGIIGVVTGIVIWSF
ncbi:MAG: DUF4337 domain-containing protein [Chloroflexi bacterium]|nr:DUF4337 domain-containing protein [Chloroflexota bacterium]